MIKTWTKWTEEEIELLKIHWKSSTMEQLLAVFPTRKYNILMQKAREVGIKSQIKRKRKGSLNFLDNITEESCYWWGFIMADGHITKKGELIITLKNVDIEHLKVLSNNLKCTVSERKGMCTLRIQDKQFGNKWLSLLEINSAKTYTPPNLSIFITKENLLPFFIGLVDGDGCIWKSKNWLNLRVELHGNWLNTLQLISDKLQEFYNISSKVKTTKKGTSKLDINTKKDLALLKEYTNKIYCMSRKWDKLQ